MRPIKTIGHSNHPIDRFVALLKAGGVRRLVDVRSMPYSRRFPQFGRERLGAMGRNVDSASGQRFGHGREPRVDQLKTRIFERTSRKRRGVLIKSEKSSANTETGEDGRAVPAATKGAIDIGSVFADTEGGHGFFE